MTQRSSRFSRPLAALALSLLLTQTGCASSSDTQPAVGVAVLVDVSASTTAVKDQYLKTFEQVLAGLQGGEQLIVIPISASSLVEPVALNEAFPAKGRLDNPVTYNRNLKQKRADVAARMAAYLDEPRSQRRGSAIIDGLEQARAILAPYPEKHLVILSDMIEQSELADFTALTEASIPALLERLKDRTPELPVTVHVAGITDGAGTLPSSQVLAIRSFWTQFLTERGATLASYGPSLLGFRGN
jgi:hypothetical protein